jgi:hypothetical protein
MMLSAIPMASTSRLTIGTLIFILALSLAFMQLVTWPFGGRDLLFGAPSYIPILIGLLGVAVIISESNAPIFEPFSNHWPMLLLGLLMCGGVVTRAFIYAEDISFKAHLLGMVGYWGSVYACAIDQKSTEGLSSRALFVLGAFLFPISIYGFIIDKHLVHETLYLVTPLGIYLYLTSRLTGIRMAGLLSIVAWAIFSFKNTTLLIAFGCLLVCLFAKPPRILRHALSGGISLLLASSFAIGIIVLISIFIIPNISTYSTGNANFRMYYYQILWDMFLESPVIGTCFSGSPALEFTLFNIENQIGTRNLPSHSDVLDLLAHGGVIGLGLFFLVSMRACKALIQHARMVREGDHSYALPLLLCSVALSGIIQMSFNPVLINPANGFSFWAILGLAASSLRRNEVKSTC